MKISVAVSLALAALALPLHAADPPELVDVRQKYEDALVSSRAPIQAKYVAQLQELLNQLTRDGDLEGALKIRAVINDIESDNPGQEQPVTTAATTTPQPAEATPPPTTAPSPEDPPAIAPPPSIEAPANAIVLSPGDASLEGALKIENGLIVNWVRTNAKASWHKRDVPAGKYDLFFVYAAGEGQGGIVEILDFSYNFDVTIKQTKFEDWFDRDRDRELERERERERERASVFNGYPERRLTPGVIERVKIGSVETRGGIGLKIIAKSKVDAGIMNLKEVHLVPIP